MAEPNRTKAVFDVLFRLRRATLDDLHRILSHISRHDILTRLWWLQKWKLVERVGGRFQLRTDDAAYSPKVKDYHNRRLNHAARALTQGELDRVEAALATFYQPTFLISEATGLPRERVDLLLRRLKEQGKAVGTMGPGRRLIWRRR